MNSGTPTLEKLTELLIGIKQFPNRENIALKQEREKAIKQNQVWVIPASYNSRPYPFYETLDSGNIEFVHKIPIIPSLILEPIKANGKGIVTLHQHAGEFHLGKSEPAGLKTGKSGNTMKYGLELAERGFLVICFDFPAFEERQYSHPNLEGSIGQEYDSHEVMFSGGALMGWHVLDTMAAVDVLQSLGIAEVGVIGHSMGGISSYYATACDARIKAGVSNCGTGSFHSVSGIPYVHNPAWLVPGMKQKLGELHQFFTLIAKRPYLISLARNDSEFTLEGTRELVRWGKQFYHNPALLQSYEFEGGHSFPEQARKNAYNFLEEFV